MMQPEKIASEDYRLYPNPIALMGFDTSGYSGDSINYYLRMQWNGLLFDTANYYTINYDSLNRRTEELKHLYNGNFLGITKKFWSYLPTGEIDQIISKTNMEIQQEKDIFIILSMIYYIR